MFAPGEVKRLAKLKKAQIAAETERLAVGSRWLPAKFVAQVAAITEASTGQDLEAEADAPVRAEIEAHEQVQASA